MDEVEKETEGNKRTAEMLGIDYCAGYRTPTGQEGIIVGPRATFNTDTHLETMRRPLVSKTIYAPEDREHPLDRLLRCCVMIATWICLLNKMVRIQAEYLWDYRGIHSMADIEKATEMTGAVAVIRIKKFSFWLSRGNLITLIHTKALGLDRLLMQSLYPHHDSKRCNPCVSCPFRTEEDKFHRVAATVKRVPVRGSNVYHTLDIELDTCPRAFHTLMMMITDGCVWTNTDEYITKMCTKEEFSRQVCTILWGESAVANATYGAFGQVHAISHSGMWIAFPFMKWAMPNKERFLSSTSSLVCRISSLVTSLLATICTYLDQESHAFFSTTCKHVWQVASLPIASPQVMFLRQTETREFFRRLPGSLRGKRPVVLTLTGFRRTRIPRESPLFSRVRELHLRAWDTLDLSGLGYKPRESNLRRIVLHFRKDMDEGYMMFRSLNLCRISQVVELDIVSNHIDRYGMSIGMYSVPLSRVTNVLPPHLTALTGIELFKSLGTCSCARTLRKLSISLSFPRDVDIMFFPFTNLEELSISDVTPSGLLTPSCFDSLTKLHTLKIDTKDKKIGAIVAQFPWRSNLRSLSLNVYHGYANHIGGSDHLAPLPDQELLFFIPPLTELKSLIHLHVSHVTSTLLRDLETGACPTLAYLHVENVPYGTDWRVLARPGLISLHVHYRYETVAPPDVALEPMIRRRDPCFLTLSGKLSLAHYQCVRSLGRRIPMSILVDRYEKCAYHCPDRLLRTGIQFPCCQPLGPDKRDRSTISAAVALTRKEARTCCAHSWHASHVYHSFVRARFGSSRENVSSPYLFRPASTHTEYEVTVSRL